MYMKCYTIEKGKKNSSKTVNLAQKPDISNHV